VETHIDGGSMGRHYHVALVRCCYHPFRCQRIYESINTILFLLQCNCTSSLFVPSIDSICLEERKSLLVRYVQKQKNKISSMSSWRSWLFRITRIVSTPKSISTNQKEKRHVCQRERERLPSGSQKIS
jgi:hypothetical protein